MTEAKKSDSFADMFESESHKTPKRRHLRVGEKVEGLVVRVGRDAVFVEVDGKREAFIDLTEVLAADGTPTVKVGEMLRASVVEVDGRTGAIRLGRSLDTRSGGVTILEQAREAGVAVEGKVVAVNKGGIEVEVAGLRAFCPISQVDNRFVQDAASLVGKVLRFMVTDIRENGRSVVLSRKAVLEAEAKESATKLLAGLTLGSTVRGTVSGVREFGAFVDLGGLEGLIPSSELSYDRSMSAADSVKIGDVVDVKVLDIKEVPAQRGGGTTTKITLSLKALAADPWMGIESVVIEGKVARGTVVRVVDFGAFVRLSSGVEGLLHVSEMGGQGPAARQLKVGQNLVVVVKKLDREAKKLSLVLAPEGAEEGASVTMQMPGVGAIVEGAVEKIEPFGVFVRIDGLSGRSGRGLIPTAELGLSRGVDLRKAMPEGTRVQARVVETGEGRLRLSVRAVKEQQERDQFETYRGGSSQKLGTLGDLIKRKR